MNIVLDEGAKMPTRAHDTDAGYDLYAICGMTIFPRQTTIYDSAGNAIFVPFGAAFDTGVHVQIPKGYYGAVQNKSGLNVKNDIVCSGTGIIDSDYTGSIIVKLYNLGSKPYTVRPGDKIAQLIIQPYVAPELVLVDALEETERGQNGFGSTGR